MSGLLRPVTTLSGLKVSTDIPRKPMTQSSLQSTTDPDIPQVLLFGHSGAGKSALLGALYQAGEKQGETLLGEVLEPSGRLASIREAIYSGKDLEKTHAELTSYTVRLRPWREGTRLVGEPFTIVLNDCSGKAAESLIRHPNSLHDPETRAPLARAVIDADAIILLVNASSDEKELSSAFAEFHAFLTIVAWGKTNAREVGGFPIYLVLTQCDKLAKPNDTRANWEERVQGHAENTWDKFHSFLKVAAHEDDFPSPFLPFGSIELIVQGVAVRLPRLVDSPGQPTTPFHVAELFRDCFAAAKSHRERVRGSNRRLKWTIRSAITFVAAMLVTSIGMILFQPPPVDFQLTDRVTAYEMHEPPAAVRLVEPNLTRNNQTLISFRDDPGYYALRDDLKEFIDSRLKEIDDYKRYRDKLNHATAPGDTRTLEELAEVEKTLRGDLALPANYSWEETPAALLRQKWLADVSAIREAESNFQDYYRNFIRRGIALTLTNSFGGNWRADVNGLLVEGARPPVALKEPLAGSPVYSSRRGEAVLNRVPYEFEGVYHARKEWDTTRDRLSHLRDLADSLNLTTGPDRPDSLLVLPEPGPGVDSTTLPTSRWNALKKTYAYLADDVDNWNLNDFPDVGRSILASRLDSYFKAGLRHVHALVQSRFGPNLEKKDTHENWLMLANLLTDSTTPFPEWGQFLQLYAKLLSSSAQNPVLELAAFLRMTSFVLDPKGLDLVIPGDLSSDKVVPNGMLTISIIHQGNPSGTKRFKQSGEGLQSGSTTMYQFTSEGTEKLTFIPGDALKAELPVRSGTQEFKLVWEGGTSQTYPFDLLSREPRLVKSTGTTEPAVGVKMTLTPNSVWPHIPVLFLELRR